MAEGETPHRLAGEQLLARPVLTDVQDGLDQLSRLRDKPAECDCSCRGLRNDGARTETSEARARLPGSGFGSHR